MSFYHNEIFWLEIFPVNLCENKRCCLVDALKCKSLSVSSWPEWAEVFIPKWFSSVCFVTSWQYLCHEAVLTDQIWACSCEMRPAAQKDIQKLKCEEYNHATGPEEESVETLMKWKCEWCLQFRRTCSSAQWRRHVVVLMVRFIWKCPVSKVKTGVCMFGTKATRHGPSDTFQTPALWAFRTLYCSDLQQWIKRIKASICQESDKL